MGTVTWGSFVFLMRVGWKDSTAEDKSYIRVRYRYREICFSTTSCMNGRYPDNVLWQYHSAISSYYHYYYAFEVLISVGQRLMSLDINLYHWSTDEFTFIFACFAASPWAYPELAACADASTSVLHCRWVFGNHPVKSTICLAFNHFENSWDTFLSCHGPCTFHQQNVLHIHSFLVISRPIQPNPLRFFGLEHWPKWSPAVNESKTWRLGTHRIDVVFGRPLGEISPHDFPVVGDGHQHESRALYTHDKDFLLRVGWPSPQK